MSLIIYRDIQEFEAKTPVTAQTKPSGLCDFEGFIETMIRRQAAVLTAGGSG